MNKNDFVHITSSHIEIANEFDLTSAGLIIFAKISNLQGEKGCYASYSYLAKIARCTTRTVLNQLKILKEAGLIKIHSFKDEKNIPQSIIFTKELFHVFNQLEEKSQKPEKHFKAHTKPKKQKMNTTTTDTVNDAQLSLFEEIQPSSTAEEPKKSEKSELDAVLDEYADVMGAKNKEAYKATILKSYAGEPETTVISQLKKLIDEKKNPILPKKPVAEALPSWWNEYQDKGTTKPEISDDEEEEAKKRIEAMLALI